MCTDRSRAHSVEPVNRATLLEVLLVALLPPILIASYFSSIPNESGGAIGLAILCLIAILRLANQGIILDSRTALLLLIIALYLSLGTLPGINVSSSSYLLLRDLLRYGVVLGALVFGAGDAIRRSFQAFVNMTVLSTLALSILGFVALFLGTYTIGPLIVSQYYPLRIGSLTVPTTSSLIWNTNYYAITLVISYAMLKFYGVSFIPRKTRIRYGLELMLIAAIILTKSRVGVALILLMFGVQFLRWLNELPARRKSFLILIGTGVAIGLIAVNHFGIGGYSASIFKAFATVGQDFFLEKGLNLRDVLWPHGLELFFKHPLGIGFGSFSEVFFSTGAPTTTVQNTFVTYLLIGGVPLGILVVVIVLTALATYLRFYHRIRSSARGPELTRFVISMLAVCSIVLIDGMARTYILGGIGFIPFMLTFAVLGGIGWIKAR